MKRVNCILLDNDIAPEVLKRLSARELHKLKLLVCKEWQQLISGRSFIKSQLKNGEPVSGFFFQEKYLYLNEDIDRISYISLEPVGVHSTVLNFLPESVVLLASCNGWVCCRSTLSSPEPALYVCNPLNKDWRSLEWNYRDRSTSVALIFDPNSFSSVAAYTHFAVVAVSRVTKTSGEPQFSFDIYSSLTGNWKKSEEKCQCKHDVFKNKGIYADGVLYWLTDGEQILMFDPKLELSWLISMPIPFSELDCSGEMCIGESNGKLHYVLLSKLGLQSWTLIDPFASLWDGTPSISVEDLEKDYGLTFEFSQNLMRPERGEGMVDLLSFKDGVLSIRYLSDIYSFEFETREMKRLCSLTQLGNLALLSPTVLPYSMSLAPLGVV